MSIKVKICGIRTLDAAEAAIDARADFLGFNFVPTSKRYIDPTLATKIISSMNKSFPWEIRGRVKTVGVFQDAESAYVNSVASKLGLDFVQLHGNENNEYIRQIRVLVIKVIQINDRPEGIDTAYFLLDRPKRGKGKMVNLEKAAELAANFPLFIAGGLTPDNVAYVVRKVRPFAVDVAGGIEIDGKESLNKIRTFIKNAKEVIYNRKITSCFL